MKVITLTEPWATLVVIGAKHFETRSWARPAQGRLLVHAAKAMPEDARELVSHPPFATPLARALDAWTEETLLAKLDARRAKIIGSVTHLTCWHTEQLRERISNAERAFGDYSDGRYGWELEQPLAYVTHVAARGMLGIWELPAELEPAVHAAAKEARLLEVRP